jgi:hypothetical protein
LFFLVGKGENLGQRAHEKDLATAPLLAGVDIDSINKRTNDFYNLIAISVSCRRSFRSTSISRLRASKRRN